MAYTPTTWATGDTITAEKLNKMEDGIATAELFAINVDYDENNQYIMDKTIDEILNALDNGQYVYASDAANFYHPENFLYVNENYYSFIFTTIYVNTANDNKPLIKSLFITNTGITIEVAS